MSFTPSISELLKFARVQMAAEALYNFNARTDLDLEPGKELKDKACGRFSLYVLVVLMGPTSSFHGADLTSKNRSIPEF